MSKFTISEKLTIGVASYGNIKTTEICVNKILDSIEGNFELILVEDFSHERDKIINFYQSIKKKYQIRKFLILIETSLIQIA